MINCFSRQSGKLQIIAYFIDDACFELSITQRPFKISYKMLRKLLQRRHAAFIVVFINLLLYEFIPLRLTN